MGCLHAEWSRYITVRQRKVGIVSLCYFRITSEDISSMGDLRPGSHLTTLSLSGNQIGDDGFQQLLSYLEGVSTIQSINVRNCGISESSIPAISSFVSRPSYIHVTVKSLILPSVRLIWRENPYLKMEKPILF